MKYVAINLADPVHKYNQRHVFGFLRFFPLLGVKIYRVKLLFFNTISIFKNSLDHAFA